MKLLLDNKKSNLILQIYYKMKEIQQLLEITAPLKKRYEDKLSF